eukprot:5522532-Pyramimonas_sp.AAC.1
MHMLPVGRTPASIAATDRIGFSTASATPLTEAPCVTDDVIPAVWMRVMRSAPTAFLRMTERRTRWRSCCILVAPCRRRT